MQSQMTTHNEAPPLQGLHLTKCPVMHEDDHSLRCQRKNKLHCSSHTLGSLTNSQAMHDQDPVLLFLTSKVTVIRPPPSDYYTAFQHQKPCQKQGPGPHRSLPFLPYSFWWLDKTPSKGLNTAHFHLLTSSSDRWYKLLARASDTFL